MSDEKKAGLTEEQERQLAAAEAWHAAETADTFTPTNGAEALKHVGVLLTITRDTAAWLAEVEQVNKRLAADLAEAERTIAGHGAKVWRRNELGDMTTAEHVPPASEIHTIDLGCAQPVHAGSGATCPLCHPSDRERIAATIGAHVDGLGEERHDDPADLATCGPCSKALGRPSSCALTHDIGAGAYTVPEQASRQGRWTSLLALPVSAEPLTDNARAAFEDGRRLLTSGERGRPAEEMAERIEQLAAEVNWIMGPEMKTVTINAQASSPETRRAFAAPDLAAEVPVFAWRETSPGEPKVWAFSSNAAVREALSGMLSEKTLDEAALLTDGRIVAKPLETRSAPVMSLSWMFSTPESRAADAEVYATQHPARDLDAPLTDEQAAVAARDDLEASRS